MTYKLFLTIILSSLLLTGCFEDNNTTTNKNEVVIENDDMDMSPEELEALNHDIANMAGGEEKESPKSDEELPISLRLKEIYGQNLAGITVSMDAVEITVKGDNIKLDGITANHGHCKLIAVRSNQYPKVYNYGDVIKNTFIKNSGGKCNILSVEIKAYGVNNSYEFNR